MTETEQKPPRSRLAEMLALYIGIPTLLTLVRLKVATFPVIPALWALALPVSIWLAARRGFTRGDFFGLASNRQIHERVFAAVVLRAIPAAVALVALLRAIHKDWLFSFASAHPGFWMVVMVAYPLVSVFPQGIIYRAFFAERYAPLFPNGTLRTVVAAACFSFSHIFFLNPWALMLTFIGGLMFYRTYEKTGSLFLSNFEHAVYGDLVFTIGYGAFLYHGTIALAASLAPGT